MFEAYVFLVGLCFGSFANVLILRMPLGKSFIRPRSHCPKCGHQLTWVELIPVFSWIFQRAKCKSCQAPISMRYPLVELLTAILFLSVYLKYGWSLRCLELLIFVFGLIVVSFIDLDHMILPDSFTLSGIVIGILGNLLIGERTLMDSLLGIFLGGGILWLIGVFYFWYRKEEGMGGGDIKLLAWIGSVLGYESLPIVILFASLLGTLVGITIILRQKKDLKTAIPFGPYLALGAIFSILGGPQIADWYLRLFFPGLV